MLNARHLKRVLEVPPGEPPNLNAVILYEDFTCGLRLKNAVDELFGELFSQVGWAALYRLSLWSFQMLKVRAISTMAAKEAAQAAVFCVAVCASQRLNPEVVSLVRDWLARKENQPCAIVLAGYGDDAVGLHSSPAGAYLRASAKRTGKLFLVKPLGQAPFRSLQAVLMPSPNVILLG